MATEHPALTTPLNASGTSDAAPPPAFVIGVTGSMKLDESDLETVMKSVRLILRWLRTPPGKFLQNPGAGPMGTGLGITEETPIVVLSSLAPGADQMVAEAARRKGHRVLAPLPFLKEQYLRASTFTKATEAEKGHVRDIPDSDWFHVKLAGEVDVDEDALKRRHEAYLQGPDYKDERNLRYRAAGEYVAAYSDLLIAISDYPSRGTPTTDEKGVPQTKSGKAPVSCGAVDIIEVKRRGITPGLLPVSPALNWADNGPVVNVFLRLKDHSYPNDTPQTGDISILHPFDCQAGDRLDGAANHFGLQTKWDEEWQRNGDRMLWEMAEHLERLNREESRSKPGAISGALVRMIGKRAAAVLSGPFRDRLDQIARARRRIGDLNVHYDTRVKRQTGWLFCLAFATVVALQVSENWEREGGTHADFNEFPWRTMLFFGLALLATGAAWVGFKFFQKKQLDERQNDYRAIAEGLRVQFYWTAAGTGQSVSSNYIQRQRGELNWVRSAISAVSFPYQQCRDWFRKLPLVARLQIFQGIRDGWVAEQLGYFRKKVRAFTARKHSVHRAGNVLLWSGLVLAIVLVSAHLPKSVAVFSRIKELAPAFLRAGGGTLAVLLVLWLVDRSWEWWVRRKHPGTREHVALSWLHFWQVVFPFWHRAGHGRRDRADVIARRLNTFAFQPLLGVALAALAIGIAFRYCPQHHWLPDTIRALGIAKILFLVGGGLMHLWIGFKFFNENIRRYDGMSSLFQSALIRMDEALGRLEVDIEGARPNDRDAESTIKDLQSMLVGLGKEALAENAEWLQMHRDRPVEPVIAGA